MSKEKSSPRGFRVKILFLLSVFALVFLILMMVDFEPSLKHVNVVLLTGTQQGNYYDLGERMRKGIDGRKGKIENLTTQGSIENVERLKKGSEACDVHFALIQDGMDWSHPDGQLELVARLSKSESMLFLGKDARRLERFQELRGMRIGIGPKGSGTALLAEQLLGSAMFSALGLQLSHHSTSEQMQMAKKGDLDLAVFVIDENAAFVKQAMKEDGLQMASFVHAKSMADHFYFLRAGVIAAGHYDPVRVIPSSDRQVLQVDTLVVGNGCASGAETTGMLMLLSELDPSFLPRNAVFASGPNLPAHKAAGRFFENRGPDFMDEYAPWLADVVPMSNLVHLGLLVSILFNVMGFGNRFRLWRIDVNRVKLEARIDTLFGGGVTVEELMNFSDLSYFSDGAKIQELKAIVKGLGDLVSNCRKYSVSLLVPMGQEMAYRYQESLIARELAALRTVQKRL